MSAPIMTATDVQFTIFDWLTLRMELNSSILVSVTDNHDHARFDIRVTVDGDDIPEALNRVEAFLFDYTADHVVEGSTFTCWMPDRFTAEFVRTYEI